MAIPHSFLSATIHALLSRNYYRAENSCTLDSVQGAESVCLVYHGFVCQLRFIVIQYGGNVSEALSKGFYLSTTFIQHWCYIYIHFTLIVYTKLWSTHQDLRTQVTENPSGACVNWNISNIHIRPAWNRPLVISPYSPQPSDSPLSTPSRDSPQCQEISVTTTGDGKLSPIANY